MTYKIWNRTTGRVVERSAVRPATDPKTQNLRANDAHDAALHKDAGTRIAQEFDGRIHFGTVHKQWQRQKQPLWRIKFDDGDDVDMDQSQFHQAKTVYEDHREKDNFRYLPPTHSP